MSFQKNLDFYSNNLWQKNYSPQSFQITQIKSDGESLVIPLIPKDLCVSELLLTHWSFSKFFDQLANSKIEQKLNEEINDFFSKNYNNITELIDECQIKIEITDEQEPEIIVGNKQALEEYLQGISDHFKSGMTSLDKEQIDDSKVQEFIANNLFQRILPTLILQKDLQNLEESLIVLKNNKYLLKKAENSEEKRTKKQIKEAIKATSVFLIHFNDPKSRILQPYETRHLIAHQLCIRNQFLCAKTEVREELIRTDEAYERLSAIENEFYRLIEPSREQAELSWAEGLLDKAGSFITWLSPPMAKFPGWLADVSSVQKTPQEQDQDDFAFVERLQVPIGKLHTQIHQLSNSTDLSEKDASLLKKIDKLKYLIDVYQSVIDFRIEYFQQAETIEKAVIDLTSQTSDLMDDIPSFSARHYQNLVREIQHLHLIAENHTQFNNNPKILKEIEKKTIYQTQFALEKLEDFFEEFDSAINVEVVEAIAQIDAAAILVQESSPEMTLRNYRLLHDRVASLKTINQQRVAFASTLQEISKNSLPPPVGLIQIEKNLVSLKKLKKETQKALFHAEQKLLEATNHSIRLIDPRQIVERALEGAVPTTEIRHDLQAVVLLGEYSKKLVSSKDIHEVCEKAKSYLDAVGEEDFVQTEALSPITKEKKRRVQQKINFEEANRLSANRKYWQFLGQCLYHGYVNLFTPTLQAMSNPIGKRDYHFYMQMMARAKDAKTANPTDQTYDYYLEQARAIAGINAEFVEKYDQFLRGEIAFSFNPVMDTKEVHQAIATGPESSVSQAFHQVEEILPESVASWLSVFLGLNPHDQLQWNRSDWDNWVHSTVFPQVRDNFFDGIFQYYNHIPSSLKDREPEGESAKFGYYCYKMYESVQDPSKSHQYTEFLAKARELKQYQSFLKEYESYLVNHPPEQVEPKLASSFPEERTFSQAVTQLQLSQGVFIEPVTSAATKTDRSFLMIWAERLGSFLNPTFPGGAESGIETNETNQAPPQFMFTMQEPIPGGAESRIETNETIDLQFMSTRQEPILIENVLQKVGEVQKQVALLEEQLSAIATVLENQPELVAVCKQLENLEKELQSLEAEKPIEGASVAATREWIAKLKKYKEESDLIVSHFEKLKLAKEAEALFILKETVETSSSFLVNDKLLLHALGDHFGKDTNLEGHIQEVPLLYRWQILSSKIDVLSMHEHPLDRLLEWAGIKKSDFKITDEQKLLDQLQTAITTSLYLKFARTDDASKYLKRNLESLSVGETYFFPGGWAGYPGHAMYYEFRKQEDGRFTLRVYNTGAGTESYHSQETVGYTDKSLTFTERVNIPLESIVSLLVVKAVQELASTPPTDLSFSKKKDSWTRIAPEPWAASDIYEGLLESIGGEPSLIDYQTEDLLDLQRAGTCTFMSLASLLFHTTGNENQFFRSQFELNLKTLVDFSKWNFSTQKHLQDSLSIWNRIAISFSWQNWVEIHSWDISKPVFDERSFRLLSKSLEAFSRETIKYHDAGIINDLEFIYASQKIVEIKNHLKVQEENYLKELESQAAQVSLEPQLKPLEENPIHLREFLSPTDDLKLTSHPSYNMGIVEWNPNPKTIVEDLSSFRLKLEEAQRSYNYKVVVMGVQDLMGKLSINWEDNEKNDLWNELSWEQAEQVIHELSQITLLGFDGLIKVTYKDTSKQRELDPQHFLSYAKGLTIAHLLASKNNADLPLKEMALDFNKVFNEESLKLYDPKYDTELSQITEYWGQKPDYPIFNVDSVPATPYDLRTIYYTKIQGRFYRNKGTAWLVEQIKKSEVRQKLTERFPNFEELSLEEQLTYAVVDKIGPDDKTLKPRDVFSRSFYDIRDMLYVGSYMLHSPIVATSNPELTTNEPLKFLYLAHQRQEDWSIATFVEGIDPSAKKGYSRLISPSLHFENAHHKQGDLNLITLFQYQRTPNVIIHEDVKSLREMKEKESRYFEGSSESPDLSLEDFRNFQSMICLSDTLKIKETLVYFIKNYHLLAKTNYQHLFDGIMFRPTLLFNELASLGVEDRKKFISQLALFSKKFFKMNLELGKIENAAYFLHLNELFKQYVDYFENHHNKSSQDAEGFKLFLDTRAEANDLLKKPYLSAEAYSFLSYVFLFSFKNHSEVKNEEEVSDILIAAIKRKTLPINPDNYQRQRDIAIDKVMLRLGKNIEKFFVGEGTDRLLNNILKAIHPELSEEIDLLKWEPFPEFPIFISDNKKFVFNLDEVYLYENLGSKAILPLKILKHRLFEEVIKTPPTEIFQVSLDTYQIIYEGESYQLISRDNELVIQRLFNINGKNSSYQYLQVENFKKKGISLNNNFWQAKEPSSKVLVTAANSLNPLYRIELHENKIETIHRLDESGNDTGLILANNEKNIQLSSIFTSSSLEFLSHFEDTSYVLTWKEQTTNEIKLIELPRFNLSFKVETVEGEKRVFSQDHPGFFLAKKQWVPALKDYPHYLLLENAKGEKKVLLPFQELVPPENDNSVGSLDTLKLVPDRRENSQKYFDYQLDKKTGNLIPSSNEACFYYCLVLLRKMEYAKAYDYLRMNRAFVASYSPEEKKILGMISHFETKDHDPRVVGLNLYANYLLLRNAISFEKSSAKLMYDIQEKYTKYLNVFDHVDPVKLTLHEELFLLEEVAAKSKVMLNRLADLDPKKAQKEASKTISVSNTIKTQEKASGASLARKLFSAYETSEQEIFIKTGFDAVTSLISKGVQLAVPVRLMNSPYVLRENILIERFIDYYRVAKEEADVGTIHHLYGELTGLHLFFDNANEAKAELLLALKLIKNTPNPDSQMLATILEAVMINPEGFPSLEELKAILRFHNIGSFISEVIDPASKYSKKDDAIVEVQASKEVSHVKKRALKPPVKVHSTQLPFELCIAHYAPTELFKTPIENLDEYIDQVCLSESEKVFTDKAELIELYSNTQAERHIEDEYREVAESVDSYDASSSPLETHYEITDFQKLLFQGTVLKSQINEGKNLLLEKELSILRKANKPSSIEVDVAEHQLQIIGRGVSPLEIDDLIQLFLHQDFDLFHQANPNLTFEEISEISADIHNYLIHSTHLNHLKRLSKNIEAIVDSKAKGVSEKEMSMIIQEFVANASAVRSYSVEDYPTYLVFEHYMEILLRKDQVDILDLLQIKEGKINRPEMIGKVVEMIMGAGKTSVVLPLLLEMIADGDNLAMAILPEPLMASMSKELADRVGPSFKKKVHVIEYSRDMPGETTKRLSTILSQLESIRKNREVLLMTSSTVQSLYLKFMETLYVYGHADPRMDVSALKGDIELFREIFRCFKEKGHVIIDEADIIINARKEHHFTLGTPIPLPDYNVELVAFLYAILNSHPEIINQVNIDFNTTEKGTPLTKEHYDEKVQPVLIKVLIEQQLGVNDEEVKAFFSSLTPSDLEKVTRFLSNEKDPEAFKFIAEIPNRKIKDLLALAKEEIHLLLRLTNTRLSDENYGLSHVKRSGISIPFHGSNNPQEKSQFGNQYETLNYTFQIYLKKGIPVSLVKAELQVIQNQAMELIKQGKPLKNSDPEKRFRELCGNDDRFQIFGSEKQLEGLVKKINENGSLKLDFIKRYIVPEILAYPITLSVDSQVFDFIFKSVDGFTGTPNPQVLPENLEAVSVKETKAKTLAVLWKNSRDAVHVIPKFNPLNFTQKVLGEYAFGRRILSLIDTGGQGRGLPNELAARQLLEIASKQDRHPPIKGVVFYDQYDRLMIIEIGKPDPIPLEQSTLSKEERITLYDQKHTTGSDIKQAFSAVALVTIGPHTTLRGLLQSARRMRGLDAGQKVEFLVDEEVKEIIASTLEKITGKKWDGELTLAEILLFVTYNQAILKGDDNFRSFKQKMKVILTKEIFQLLLDPATDYDEIKEIFLAVEKHLVTFNTDSTWEMFGRIEDMEENHKVLESEIEGFLNSEAVLNLENQSLLAKRIDRDALKTDVKALGEKNLKILPEKLPTTFGGFGIEAEREIEKEMDKETEKQSEIEEAQESKNIYEEKKPINLKISLERLYSDFFIPVSIEKARETIEQAAENVGQLGKRDLYGLAKSINPFVELNQVFSAYEDFKEVHELFDPAIAGSLNLFQIYDAGVNTATYAPFDLYQKEISSFLIVENKETGELSYVLFDQNDEMDIKSLLIQDHQQKNVKDEDKKTRLGVYVINYGIYQQGVETLDEQKIAQNPQFLNALVQIKFLKGETRYTEQELPYLKQWIDKDPKKLFALFKKVAQWKPSVLAALPTSDIGGIFKEHQLIE